MLVVVVVVVDFRKNARPTNSSGLCCFGTAVARSSSSSSHPAKSARPDRRLERRFQDLLVPSDDHPKSSEPLWLGTCVGTVAEPLLHSVDDDDSFDSNREGGGVERDRPTTMT